MLLLWNVDRILLFLFYANRPPLSEATIDLLIAAQKENTTTKMIHDLIKLGADVKAKSNLDGWTALMYAAMFNSNPEVIFTLLRAGSNVNAKDKFGTTVLMCAAAGNSNPEVIRTLLRTGSKVNTKDKDGETALMLAAGHNSNAEAIIPVLLNAGADIFAKNNEGKTALDYAKTDSVKDLILNAAQ